MAESQYYHVDLESPDRTASENNIELERVVNDIAVPFRLNRPFHIDGYEFRANLVTRLKIRRTNTPIEINEVMSQLDLSSISNAFSSLMSAGTRLQEGVDVTEDILVYADQVILKSGETAEPHSPIFDRTNPKNVFVVTSFSKELEQNFDAIDRACKAFGLHAIRVDKEMSSESIIERIQRHLLDATYVIADLTQARPNCYYEIGFFDALLIARKASSKNHLLLVAQNIAEDAHFDLKHRGIEQYNNPFTLLGIVEAWFDSRGLTKR